MKSQSTTPTFRTIAVSVMEGDTDTRDAFRKVYRYVAVAEAGNRVGYPQKTAKLAIRIAQDDAVNGTLKVWNDYALPALVARSLMRGPNASEAIYCKSLRRVTKAELVNALHQSLMQLRVQDAEDARRDGPFISHKSTIAEASRLMAKAGHPGFTS